MIRFKSRYYVWALTVEMEQRICSDDSWTLSSLSLFLCFLVHHPYFLFSNWFYTHIITIVMTVVITIVMKIIICLIIVVNFRTIGWVIGDNLFANGCISINNNNVLYYIVKNFSNFYINNIITITLAILCTWFCRLLWSLICIKFNLHQL